MAKYPPKKVREWFEAWKKSRRPLGQFKPVGAPGSSVLTKLFKEQMPDEYSAHIASRRKRSAKVGAEFERRCKKALEEAGWFVIKAGGSKGPADLVSLNRSSRPLLVQCKTNGDTLTITERQELIRLASHTGGIPILAYKGPKRQGIKWITLDTNENWKLEAKA